MSLRQKQTVYCNANYSMIIMHNYNNKNTIENLKNLKEIRGVVQLFFGIICDKMRLELKLWLHCCQALLSSYMRPVVANLTNSSAFPAYNLPFIKFSNGE